MATNKLQLLHKIQSDKEEKLKLAYLEAEQNLQSQQQKLKGLNDFRLDYSMQLSQKGQQGLSSAGFSHFQNFINKIEQAIKQQSSAVSTAKQVSRQRQSLWLAEQVKTKAIAKLIEKQQQKQQQQQAKVEQLMLDEFATNQFFANRSEI